MEIGGLWQTKCLPYQGKGSKHCPAFQYSWFGQDAKGKTGSFARIDQEIRNNRDDLRRFSNRPPIGAEWDLPFTMMYAERTVACRTMTTSVLQPTGATLPRPAATIMCPPGDCMARMP